MPKRWVVGGIWAISMSVGLLAFGRNAKAERPEEPRRILIGDVEPRKILISDVIITGNQRVSTEHVKGRRHTKVGDEYEPAVVDDDIRELYKTGQFSYITTRIQPDGIDHIRIYFGVREMPNMVQKVTFLGAKHIKNEDLLNLTGVRPNSPLNPHLNHWGCQKILDKYAEMGRAFTDCQLIKGGDSADTEVVYQITEGPKVKVRDIKFVGDLRFVSAAYLTTKAKSSPQWFHHIGGIFNEQAADAEVAMLYSFFRGFGFQDVRISPEIQRSPDGAEVALILHIQEGSRYRIQDVPDVHGSQEIPREQLIALSSFKPGDYLDEETLKQDIKAIKNYMVARGLDARVEAIPVWFSDKPGVCNIRYEILEMPLWRIGKIHVSGNKRIPNESILAHVSLRSGQTFSGSDLQQAEKRLAELGLFVVDAATGVRPTITVIDPDTEGESKDLRITVKEKPKAKPKRTKPGE